MTINMSKRVVVTGMGAITPIGKTVDEFWAAVKGNKCGVDYIKSFDTTEYEAKVAAQVKDYNPKDYLDRKEVKRIAKFGQFGLIAAEEAVKMSGLDFDKEDKSRIGVIVGSGVGCLETLETEHKKLLEKGPSRVSPMFIPKMIANMAAGNIAIKYGLNGICTSIVTACASGTQSIGDAFRDIKHGYSDIILAGGAESCITPLGVAGFTSLTALSTSDDPSKASRPFDKDRDGFVMGEGAGILVLEELEHALNRGATIYGEIVGYGATCDAYHITSPSPEGESGARAMTLAMEEGGVEPSDISYVNAHGTSTEYNDKFETLAIKKALKEHATKVPISSTKSMVGHLLGAAGAVESIVCLKSILENYVHPTIGLETPDESCDLDYVPNEGRTVEVNYVLSNSLGFGGHNGTLLFKKY